MTAAGIGRNDDQLRNAQHCSPHFAGPGWAQPAGEQDRGRAGDITKRLAPS